MDRAPALDRLETRADRRRLLLNLVRFAVCLVGLLFIPAVAYVDFLLARGHLQVPAAPAPSWISRTCRRWPPSSRCGPPPTRSASPARWLSTPRSDLSTAKRACHTQSFDHTAGRQKRCFVPSLRVLVQRSRRVEND